MVQLLHISTNDVQLCDKEFLNLESRATHTYIRPEIQKGQTVEYYFIE